ncbi:MAG TPA: hypothetical protein VFL13_04955 [Candidatus Baltobacteraceae bacterium]|nr:hypothetical protein [Candidatus Baltobacteraceae bacterium]
MRFVLSLFAGLAAAIVAAIAWAAISAGTSFQIGYMSIGVGFLVALAVRLSGHSRDPKFAYLSAVLSLFGCMLGNYLTAIVNTAHAIHVDLVSTSIDNLGQFFRILGDTFSPMDLVFYAIGMYFGYKYSLDPRAGARRQAPPPDAPPGVATA